MTWQPDRRGVWPLFPVGTSLYLTRLPAKSWQCMYFPANPYSQCIYVLYPLIWNAITFMSPFTSHILYRLYSNFLLDTYVPDLIFSCIPLIHLNIVISDTLIVGTWSFITQEPLTPSLADGSLQKVSS